jgi:hypothetical protein
VVAVVTGPFRSGTSLVARIVSKLGFEVGPEEELFEASEWNPAGYFQRPDITSVNTALINAHSGSIASPPHPTAFRENLSSRFLGELSLPWLNDLAVIKDPRFSSTLAAWVRWGPLQGQEVKLILVTRDAEDVAKSSLLHYDVKGFVSGSEKTAADCANLYMELGQQVAKTIGVIPLTVSYEQLVKKPEEQIHHLSRYLGISDPQLEALAVQELRVGISRVQSGLES